MNWAKIVAVCLQKFLFPQFCLPKSTTHKLHYSVKKNAANSNKKVDDRWSVSLPRKIHKKEVFSFALFYCLMLSKSSAQQGLRKAKKGRRSRLWTYLMAFKSEKWDKNQEASGSFFLFICEEASNRTDEFLIAGI